MSVFKIAFVDITFCFRILPLCFIYQTLNSVCVTDNILSTLKMLTHALAGWLSCLEHPLVRQKVEGSISDWGK